MFLHPQIPDFQILSDHNKPYINGKMIYSALMTGSVLQGHSCSHSSYLSAGIKQKGEDLLSGAPRALALPQQV